MTESAQITQVELEPDDQFSLNVASVGGALVVGSHEAGGPGPIRSALYVYRPQAGRFDHTQKIMPRAPNGDALDIGYSLGGGGSILVAGCRSRPAKPTASACAFRFIDGRLAPDGIVGANDPDSGDGFGMAVATDGLRIAVGAAGKKVGGIEGAGAVYIFERVGGGWTQAAKLVASDPEE